MTLFPQEGPSLSGLDAFDRDGYLLVREVLDTKAVGQLIQHWETIVTAAASESSILAGSRGPAYGARNLLQLWPEVVDLTRVSPIESRLLQELGLAGGVVRGLFFDKPPGHSWALPWHKDFTIAVQQHQPSREFTKPTVKAGVPHLEAPERLLRQMVTVRVHLDPMREENGALRVIPGSHLGDETRPPLTIDCEAGDVLLMRPLLTHSSGHGHESTTLHRRILHLECAPGPDLPDGLHWYAFHPIRR